MYIHCIKLIYCHFLCTQILTNWISYLKEVSVPTQPFEIRQCVAKQLAELWVCALGDCAPLVTLCNLVVALLQDSDEDVRTQAAQSVTKILSGAPVVLYVCLFSC